MGYKDVEITGGVIIEMALGSKNEAIATTGKEAVSLVKLASEQMRWGSFDTTLGVVLGEVGIFAHPQLESISSILIGLSAIALAGGIKSFIESFHSQGQVNSRLIVLAPFVLPEGSISK